MEMIELDWRDYNDDAMEEDGDYDLETLIEETMEEHVAELAGILGRRWSCHHYPMTVIESAHRIAAGALSLEEAVSLAVDRLEAAPDHLAPVIAGYFGMLMREWLGVDDEDGGDEILSQFRKRQYNNVEEDGEETDNCCICLERLRCGLVATLHCRHEFHGDCIRRWLRRGHNFCPLCKATAFN